MVVFDKIEDDGDRLEITVKEGTLRGVTLSIEDRGTICAFYSIPYAEPPFGDLRFKAPVPKQPWSGVLDCTEEKSECFHYSPFSLKDRGCENCLNLNIYTPQVPKGFGIRHPVMVFFRTFNFVGCNCKDFYGPDYLVPDNNLVLVTVSYRIGLLGFLSCEDQTLGVPGNAGLKDQVMALKWVKRNIKHFSGDPKNITIFGQGAGAASVHLHILSPMSKGLFHKAIMQSGCALNPWVNGVRGTCKLLAKALYYESDDEEKILEYLRALDLADISIGQVRIMNPLRLDVNWIGSPVVETQKNEPAFLPDTPINILRSGNYNHVPIIIGYNSLEGMVFDIFNIKYTGQSLLISDFSAFIPNDINCKRGSPYSETISKKIQEFYYSHTHDDPNLWDKMPIFNLVTDTFSLRGIDTAVRLHLQTSKMPVFYYRFNLDSRLNIFKRSVGPVTTYSRYAGACYGDDIGYLFRTKLSPDITDDQCRERKLIDRMVWMWTKFATVGDPTPTDKFVVKCLWKPAVPQAIYYMDISDTLKVKLKPDRERMKFWDIIYHNDLRTKYY